MGQLFEELKRRNVFRVGIAYLVAAWLLMQVNDLIAPILELPDWTPKLVFLLLAIGFIPALIFAWAFELTPEGVKREKDVDRSRSITHNTGRKLDFMIIAVLAVVVVYFVVDKFVIREPETAGVTDTATVGNLETGNHAAEFVEAKSALLPNSIAVLPFDNMSPSAEDAYFASGIHEEVLNQLSKISALTVIARTTMKQYEGTKKPVPVIADELRVGAVMEGSVRYADNKVRVTIQLIDPKTGGHLWSASYDRELADIFAIQTDIAVQVAKALETTLLPAERESIAKVSTESPQAYSFYLRHRELSTAFDFAGALRSLDQAIAIDPNFAEAYASRAHLRAWTVPTSEILGAGAGLESNRAEYEAPVLQDAQHALALDPNLGQAYIARGLIDLFNWRWDDARQAFKRALEASPNDPDVLRTYAMWGPPLGDTEGAIVSGRKAIQLDPQNPNSHLFLGVSLKIRDIDASAAAVREAHALNPTSTVVLETIASIEAARGNHAEAENALRLAEQLKGNSESTAFSLTRRAHAYSSLGLHDDAMRAFNAFKDWASVHHAGAGFWALGYLAIGEHDQALEWLTKAAEQAEAQEPDSGMGILMLVAINRFADPILEQPEFLKVRERILGRKLTAQ